MGLIDPAKAEDGGVARLRRFIAGATVGRVETDQSHFTLVVVLGAALLMILTAVTARRLEWKRPAPQRLETGRDRPESRHLDEPRPRWRRIFMVSAPCAVVGIAVGFALGSAVAPPATVAYVAAAFFVAVLAFATR